jgi:hypothetical protein
MGSIKAMHCPNNEPPINASNSKVCHTTRLHDGVEGAEAQPGFNITACCFNTHNLNEALKP